jgi:hypothetical protein
VGSLLLLAGAFGFLACSGGSSSPASSDGDAGLGGTDGGSGSGGSSGGASGSGGGTASSGGASGSSGGSGGASGGSSSGSVGPDGGSAMHAASCSGTIYYVAASGSDSNSGTSPSTPWQTIAKANAGPSYAGNGLSAGQCLLFNGGDTFSGCLYMAAGINIASSSSSNPIVLGSYGHGNATIVGASACQNTGVSNNKWGAVMIDAANAQLSGFVMQGLNVRAGSGYGNGVLIQSISGAGISNIIVQNNDIGGFNTPNGNPYGSAEVLVQDSPNEPSGGGGGAMTNIQILNNALHGLNGANSPDATGITIDGAISNSLVSGNSVYDIGGTASDTGAGIGVINDSSGPANLSVSHNVIHDIGGNVTSCGGMSGIETANVDTIIISNNEVYNSQPYPSYSAGCDWDGIDLDGSSVNSIVEYNYTHNNRGAGLLAWMGLNVGPTWGNNIYRYNISENDNTSGQSNSWGSMTFSGEGNAVSGLQVYNNTIYQANASGTNSAVAWVGNNAPTNSVFENNLLVTSSSDIHTGCNNYNGGSMDLSGITFSTNGYAGGPVSQDWNGCSGNETASITAPPSFLGPVPAGTLTWTPPNGPQPGPAGYASTSSALIGKGTAITGSGGSDYFGSAVPSSLGTGYGIGAGN